MLEIEQGQDHEDLMNCFTAFVLYLKDKKKLVDIFVNWGSIFFGFVF